MQGALRATLSVHAASWSSDLLTPPVASRQNVRLCPLSAINSILFASAESICSCTACLGWSMGADEAPIVSAVTNLQRRGSWVASLQVSTEISMPSSRCQESATGSQVVCMASDCHSMREHMRRLLWDLPSVHAVYIPFDVIYSKSCAYMTSKHLCVKIIDCQNRL